jgi:ATP-dependent DNA ligase
MSEWREFRLVKAKKTLIWRIMVDGEWYHTQSGMENGQFQSFKDRPGDKGLVGSKAYVNAENNAIFNANREIRKKEEKGYAEFIDGKLVKERITSITSFDEPLPKNFCPMKPNSNISDSAHEKIFKSGKARYTRKRDGFCSIFVRTSCGWECYSRRMDINTEWFPNHIALLEKSASEYDVGTVIVGEMVCLREDGSDNYKATSRVCRSDADVARKLIEDKECPEPTFFIFDILFHNGKSLHDKTYDERSKLWKDITWKNDLIQPVTFHDVTIDNWMEVATKNKWEGFVIVDGNCIPGEKLYSFDGKPDRPNGHHKLKVTQTTECVVYAVSEGNGKRLGSVGAIFIKQIDPDTGLFFNCGKCGSGFNDETTEEMNKLCKEKGIPFLKKDPEALKIDLQDSSHDIVVEMEYGERQEETNKFKFPVFLRIRSDKTASECIANI